MYIQNVNDIKAVAIMLDGCILDLNRYRYNYYKNICEQNNITITKQEFYNQLGSQYTMYNSLPLSDKYKSSTLNQKIEDEMYAYLKYKGIYTKEGLFELLDYFRQKDIQVAVLSTHRTKKAVEYLQMTRVFSHVHFIIGSDTKYKPLPSSDTLEAITQQFDIKPKQLLVISPFLSLNLTANDFGANVIYYKDLVEPTSIEKSSSIKTVGSFFEILNYLLLEKAYDSNMYSSILGMSNKMNKEELDKVNDHLKEIYHDDDQLLNIVQDTYEYHLSQLNENYPKKDKQEIKETIIEEDTTEVKRESITTEATEEKEDITEVIEEDIIEESDNLIEDTQEHKNILSLNKQQEVELTTAWEQLISKEETTDEDDDEYEDNEEKDISIVDILIYFFSEFIYSITISFLILLAGIVIALLGRNILINNSFVMSIFNSYIYFIEQCVSIILNGLHSIISFIPNYSHYITNIDFLSPDGMQLLHILLFNGLIIYVIKIIYFIFNKDKAIYNQDDE